KRARLAKKRPERSDPYRQAVDTSASFLPGTKWCAGYLWRRRPGDWSAERDKQSSAAAILPACELPGGARRVAAAPQWSLEAVAHGEGWVQWFFRKFEKFL